MQSLFPLTLTVADSFHGLTILLDAAVKGLAVLAVAAAATLALRRGSAALRHLVWSLSVLGLLCIPVLSVTLPQWRVPLLPSWAAVPAPVPVPTPAAAPQATVETPPMPLPPVTVALSDPWQGAQGELPAGTAFPAETEPLATAASMPASVPPSPHWSIWVLLGWAAGLLAMTVPLVVGTVGIRLSRRRAAPVTDPQWLSLLERLRRQLGVHRPIVLLRSSRSIIPLTCGLVRPVILLPAEADLWSQECRTMVLLHELAHIRRRDCLTQLLARLARVLYWFNPLVWLAGRMLRVERERACDDMVLAAGHQASAYAAHLLEIVSTLRSVRCPSLAAVAMAKRSQFEGRMLAILDPRRNRRALTRLGVVVAALLVAGVVVPIAGIRATTADKPAATSGESTIPAEAMPAAADEVAWSEALNGLRVRLTAPSGTVYRQRAALPLLVEVQNVGDKPIPFSKFAPQVRIRASDAKGAWMGIPRRSPELSPWEGRTDSLAPGDIVRLTVWFDRLRFVKPVERGSSLDLKVSAPTQLEVPGQLPKEVYSPPVTVQIKDEFPSLASETDLTGEWTAAMDLTFWEHMGLMGQRAMHIDGQGRVTMLSGSTGRKDPLMPPGRTGVILDKQRLDRLARLLRDQQVWRLAAAKRDIAYPDEEEIRLSLANGGTSLVGDYPLHVAKDQPSLMALRTEMHALMADAVAAAHKQSEGSGERPGEAEAGLRTGELTPEQEKERDRLLAEADQRLRKGLIALGEEFPRLKAVHHWNLVAGQSSPGSMIVHLSTVTEESKTTGGVDVAEGERFSLLVNIIPADRVDKQQLKVGILYRNLGLFGITTARADDPKLDAALKKLLDDALSPLKVLDDQVGKSQPDAKHPAEAKAAAAGAAPKTFAEILAAAPAATPGLPVPAATVPEKTPPTARPSPASGEVVGSDRNTGAGFDTFRVEAKSTWAWNRTLVFRGDGTYTFQMQTLEQVPGEKRMQPSKTPYVASYRLSPGDLEEFARLLKATEWLSMPASPGPVADDATEYAMTLSRGQETARRTYHEADKVQAYVDLTRFLRRVERQEELLFAVTHREAPFPGSRDLGDELDGMMGGRNRARPYAPALDYQRLVPTYGEFLANPRLSPQLAADAAKLMGYLKLESQRRALEGLVLGRASGDPSVPGEVRKAAVEALGLMGTAQSLDVLKTAGQADGSVRDAVADALATAPSDKAVPILKDLAGSSQEAAWVLIRQDRAAEPALHEIFTQPGDETVPSGRAAYHVIRAYVDHWKELPGPPSAATVSAVQDRIRLTGKGSLSGRYGLDLLRLADVPFVVPDAWQSVEEFLSMMSDRGQTERQNLFLPKHFTMNPPPARFLEDARGGTLKVRAARVDGTMAWVHVADDKNQAHYALLLGFDGGVLWTIEAGRSLPAEKVQEDLDRFLKSHPNAQAIRAAEDRVEKASSGRGTEDVRQFAKGLLAAIHDKDLATVRRWSAGAVGGWLTPEEAKELPGPAPEGWSAERLKTAIKEIHEMYAGNPERIRDVRAVEVRGNWAGVHMEGLGDEAAPRLVLVLQRTSEGWRLADVAEAKGALAQDLEIHATGLGRWQAGLVARRAKQAKEAARVEKPDGPAAATSPVPPAAGR